MRWSLGMVIAMLVAALGCGSQGGASSTTGGGGSGGAPPMHPPADCPVASMIDDFPGEYGNAPYDPKPLADACVAREHDVIIVLGCPSNDDGTPSTCQTKRADLAVALMKAGFGERFITSGAAVHNMFVEADALRDLLVARGVATGDIFTETKAQHTDENLYYSTKIMEQKGYLSALVVSDDPGHLFLTAVCDSNCCVDLGRLTIREFPTAGGNVLAGHYARYPWGAKVTAEECAQIEQPAKFMCVNLSMRKACADHFQL